MLDLGSSVFLLFVKALDIGGKFTFFAVQEKYQRCGHLSILGFVNPSFVVRLGTWLPIGPRLLFWASEWSFLRLLSMSLRIWG